MSNYVPAKGLAVRRSGPVRPGPDRPRDIYNFGFLMIQWFKGPGTMLARFKMQKHSWGLDQSSIAR